MCIKQLLQILTMPYKQEIKIYATIVRFCLLKLQQMSTRMSDGKNDAVEMYYLAPDIREQRKNERNVEAKLQHVVPPDVTSYMLAKSTL